MATSIARYLHAYGIARVYGVPGEDHLPLLAAIVDEGLTYVGAHDETAACIMASAEGQRTGTPGVALVTLAPGLTNAINGIANAYLDNLPLIVICGQHPTHRQASVIRQYLDNRIVVGGVTKAYFAATTLINHDLSRTFATAVADLPGPVLLEVRDEVAKAETADDPDEWNQRPIKAESSWEIPMPIADRLSTALYPVILFGSDARDDLVTHLLPKLAAQLRAPIFLLPCAKGRVASGDPWLAGTFLNGNIEENILNRADAILAIDLRANEIFNRAWKYVPIISLAPRPAFQRYFPYRDEIIGSLGGLLAALHKHVTGRSIKSSWTPGAVAAYRNSVENAFVGEPGSLTIPEAIKVIRQRTPDDTIVAVDAGFGKPILSYLWSTDLWPSYFSSGGLSTMGYAIPAANGLQLCSPRGQRVIAFMGDGSLLMRAPEISVASELHLPCIFFVWMDAALTQIGIKQRRSGWLEVGTHLSKFSCAKIATAFGTAGVDVTNLADLSTAVDAALARTTPTLIGIHVNQSHTDEWFELLRG